MNIEIYLPRLASLSLSVVVVLGTSRLRVPLLFLSSPPSLTSFPLFLPSFLPSFPPCSLSRAQELSNYVDALEQARLSESAVQTRAIRRGLQMMVPERLLSLLSWANLERHVRGELPPIALSSLRAVVRYGEGSAGLTPTSPRVRFFWRAVGAMGHDQRRSLLRWVGMSLDVVSACDGGDPALRRITLLCGEREQERGDDDDAGAAAAATVRVRVVRMRVRVDSFACMLWLPAAKSQDEMFEALILGCRGVCGQN